MPFRLRSERDKFFRQTGRGRAFLAEGYACTKVSKEAFKSKDANWFSEFVKMFSGRAGIGVVGILLQNVFVNVMAVP